MNTESLSESLLNCIENNNAIAIEAIASVYGLPDTYLLHQAVNMDGIEYETVESLIKAKADPNQVDKNGLIPLQIHGESMNGANGDAINILRLLIDETIKTRAKPAKPVPAFNFLEFRELIWKGDLKAIKEALKSGFQPARENVGDAICFRRADVLYMMLDNGLDPNKTEPNRNPLITIAATCGSVECINTLISFGADVNAVTYLFPETALQIAAANNDWHISHILLKAGADVNLVNKQGETALYRACRCLKPNLETLKTLCRHGANLHQPDKDGVTPAQLLAKTQPSWLEQLELIVKSRE